MAYMSRLGLWGAGSAFDDFEAFLDSMKKRGVSFLEMLVRPCRYSVRCQASDRNAALC
jgi:P-loop containing NTP hydrolase pore-1